MNLLKEDKGGGLHFSFFQSRTLLILASFTEGAKNEKR